MSKEDVYEKVSLALEVRETFYYEDKITVKAIQGRLDPEVTFFEVRSDNDFFFSFTVKENIISINEMNIVIQTYLRLHGKVVDLKYSEKTFTYKLFGSSELQTATVTTTGNKQFCCVLCEINKSLVRKSFTYMCNFYDFKQVKLCADSLFYTMLVPLYAPNLHKYLLSLYN